MHGRHFATRRAAMDEVINWLGFYNARWLHSTLDTRPRQPHDVREELAGSPTRRGRITPSVMGLVKQGHGHAAQSPVPENIHSTALQTGKGRCATTMPVVAVVEESSRSL
jgi:hypothetical protein